MIFILLTILNMCINSWYVPFWTDDTSVAYVLKTTPSLKSAGKPNTLKNINNHNNNLSLWTVWKIHKFLEIHVEQSFAGVKFTVPVHIVVQAKKNFFRAEAANYYLLPWVSSSFVIVFHVLSFFFFSFLVLCLAQLIIMYFCAS